MTLREFLTSPAPASPRYHAHVPGEPVPYGNFRISLTGGKPRLYLQNAAEMKAWQDRMRAAMAVSAPDRLPAHEAWEVQILVMLARPRGHLGVRGLLRKLAPLWPWVRPDLDKIIRATLDCATDRWWRDDGAVVRIVAEKAYVNPGSQMVPGVRVWARPLTGTKPQWEVPEWAE